jgi:hypothetical protein
MIISDEDKKSEALRKLAAHSGPFVLFLLYDEGSRVIGHNVSPFDLLDVVDAALRICGERSLEEECQ